MKKRHKSYQYKFTRKKHSKRGIVALVLAILSIAGGVATVLVSFVNQGEGSVYLGSAGLFSMLLALLALIVALSSLGEDSYKLFPLLGTVTGLLSLAAWTAVYITGFIAG